MASFTDKPTQFNPYISQLPVQAMVEVGMEKQRRYDEGVERIQQSIDKIMDFDIVKQGHKDYLQSKLSDLNRNLKFVAAADFSDNQLVKSVSGMSGKIARDPIIQNAVSSTASYRKQLALLEEARKKGESSPGNEFTFGEDTNKWLKDPDLSTPFSVSYQPYFDAGKLMVDRLKEVMPDGYDVTSFFQTDANGAILRDNNGVPIYSDVMIRLKKEGKFPEKIKAVVDSVLADPRVVQQMQIDGRYNYRGASTENLVRLIGQEGETQINKIRERIGELETEKSMSINQEEKDNINKVISQHRNTMKDIREQIEQSVISIDDNPDRAKGIIQAMNTRSSWMDMYTYLKTETEVDENPYVTMDLKKKEFAFKQQQWSADYALRVATLNATKEQNKFENDLAIAELNAEYGTGAPDTTIDAMPGNTNMGDWWIENRSRVARNYTTSTDNLLAATVVKGDPSVYMKAYKVGEAEAKRMMIDAEAKKQGMTPIQFRGQMVSKVIAQLNRDPSKLTTAMKGLKTSFENASREQQKYMIMDEKLRKEAPLSDNPTKEELERWNTAIQGISELYPYQSTVLITGKEGPDKVIRQKVGTLIGEYQKARQNTSNDFRNNIATINGIVNGEIKGSFKLQADKSSGVIKHRLIFNNEQGYVGTMDITEGEARYLGVDTDIWFKPEQDRLAMQILKARNGKTSFSDPSETTGYYSNDAILLKSDFRNLVNAPYDVKGNVEAQEIVTIDGRVTTQFIPYLFYNDGNIDFVKDLPAAPSMEAALNSLRNQDMQSINQLLHERQNGRR